MTVQLLFFSDTHLGFEMPVRPRVSKRRRGDQFFENFEHVLDEAVRRQVDAVVHGGDFFFRSKVHPAIVDRAYASLNEFADHGIPIFIVPGNHERSVMPPSLFLSHPNIHVFDVPRQFRLSINGHDVCLSGFPFVRDVRGQFPAIAAQLAKPETADFHLFCFHHAVEGATCGPGDFTFRWGDDVIRQRDINTHVDADLVLTGHIHRHQVLNFRMPVLYCGSIERTSRAENNETKGYCHLTLNMGDAPVINFHPLPTMPIADRPDWRQSA